MVVIGSMILVHEDERRSIVELNSPAGEFSVQSFEIKDNKLCLNKIKPFIFYGFFKKLKRKTLTQ